MREHLYRESYFSNERNLTGLGQTARLHTVIMQQNEIRGRWYDLVIGVYDHEVLPDDLTQRAGDIVMQEGSHAVIVGSITEGAIFYALNETGEVKEFRHGIDDGLHSLPSVLSS